MEKDKMLAGELHNPGDPALTEERNRAKRICREYNNTTDDMPKERISLLKKLIPNSTNEEFWIEPPFFCDYGSQIVVGKNVFFNTNCMILDVNTVTIGSNVMFGPCVQIHTTNHPIKAKERRTGYETALPVDIGDDVWIGAGAIILPGVKIGARSVIGAGSVVTKDIPKDVVAVGNPCKVLKKIDQ